MSVNDHSCVFETSASLGAAPILLRLISFFTRTLTRSTIALFGFISFVAISWGTYDSVSMLMQKSAALAYETQGERNNSLLLELVWLQQQIKIDVIQVQRLSMYYSVARAQDGHDNIIDDAAKFAERFSRDIAAAQRAAESLGCRDLVNALSQIEQLFPDYYARGVEMNKIHTAEGHSTGSNLLAGFDALDTEMQKLLVKTNSTLDSLKSLIASNAALASSRIRAARDSQSSIALAGIVFTALTCLIGVLLAQSLVIQPLSWIIYCFKRLAENDFDYDVHESSRADEVGALGRTYQEFRQLTLERQQLSYETQLLSQLNEWLQSCKSLDELYEVVTKFLTRLLPNCAGSLFIYANSRDVLENVKAWSGGQISSAMQPDDCWGLRRGRTFTRGENEIDFHCGHVDSSNSSDYCCIPILAHGETIGLLHLEFGAGSLDDEKLCRTTVTEQRRLGVICAEQISMAIANVKLRDQLRDQSIRDVLTGLYNRRYLLESCRREFSRAARTGQCISLLSIDVDHFKKLNDNHGHDAGDTLLRAISECLENCFRKEDIPCRFGGEEFVVVLPGITSDIALQKAEMLRSKVESLEIRYLEKTLPRTTISVGIAAFPECGDNPQAVIKAADEVLYRAKANGRNRVEVSSLLGLSAGVSAVHSVLLQRAGKEDVDVFGQSNKAA